MTDLMADGELVALRREQPRPDVVEAMLQIAKGLQAQDPQRALVVVEEARGLAVALGDIPGQAHALYRQASLAYMTGAVDAALGHALDARTLARDGRAPVVEAWSLNLMGLVQVQAGNYSEALGLCLDALEVYRGTGETADEGNLLNSIAAIHQQLGDTERALTTYEEAFKANQGQNRPEHDVLIIANIAALRGQRGDGRLAVVHAKEAVALAREHAPAHLPEVLTTLGRVLRAGRGAPHGARPLRRRPRHGGVGRAATAGSSPTRRP